MSFPIERAMEIERTNYLQEMEKLTKRFSETLLTLHEFMREDDFSSVKSIHIERDVKRIDSRLCNIEANGWETHFYATLDNQRAKLDAINGHIQLIKYSGNSDPSKNYLDEKELVIAATDPTEDDDKITCRDTPKRLYRQLNGELKQHYTDVKYFAGVPWGIIFEKVGTTTSIYRLRNLHTNEKQNFLIEGTEPVPLIKIGRNFYSLVADKVDKDRGFIVELSTGQCQGCFVGELTGCCSIQNRAILSTSFRGRTSLTSIS